MKKHILKKLLLFGFILFQFGCNLEEEFVTEKNHQENIKIRYLYGKEALKKGKNLEAKMMTSNKINVLSRTNISLSTNEGTVDYTKVLEVIDENNNVNYTFNILNHPEDSETVFHNLVLSNENTNEEEILLLKYESEIPNTSIINFTGTITTKSISSATNPCDTSTSPVDFTGFTGSDNGSSVPIAGDNNNIVTPPYSGGGTSGGNSGNSLSDVASFVCNSDGCNFSTTSVTAMQSHYAPQGFTLVHRFNKTSTTNLTNPCDPNGNIGIISDSTKTPCKRIKTNTDKQQFKDRLALLMNPNHFTLNYEIGFGEVLENGQNIYKALHTSPTNPNSGLQPIPGLKNFTHIHPNIPKVNNEGDSYDGSVKIFSPGDLSTLLTTCYFSNAVPEDAYAIMLSEDIHYAMTLTEPLTMEEWGVINNNVNFPKFKENFKRASRTMVLIDDTNERNDKLQKMFLQEMNKLGIGHKFALFKGTITNPTANPSISWTRLKLNNNTIIPEPCI